jgi:hypothetical protein
VALCAVFRELQSTKYEFESSNTAGTTFAFDACFVWKLAPLADERNGLFHRISIAMIDAIEHVLNVANSYLAYSAYFRVRRRARTVLC